MLGNMPLSFRFIRDVKKVSKKFDIIHLHMPFPLGDAALLLSGYKGKIVVWWHSDIVRQKKLMLLYRPLMERFLKRADVIITATQGHIDGSAYLAPYKDKCVIIPFGVDPEIEAKADEWLAQKISKDSVKEQNRCIRFLFVGRLIYYKGCKVLLEAFCQVSNAELIIVGDGVLEKELKELANQYLVSDKIKFVGNIGKEELERHFAECYVFVLPSIARSEAFGLVQIEAMSYGKPVINTNLPSGVPYVSIHKETGLTVEPGDVNGLADAMNWMVQHPNQRKIMGEKARRRVKEEYQMDQMMEKILSLYQKLCE